jgi:hypothetical protein
MPEIVERWKPSYDALKAGTYPRIGLNALEYVVIQILEELSVAEQERDRLKASVLNLLKVFDSMDVYGRYEAVREDARAALAEAEKGKP